MYLHAYGKSGLEIMRPIQSLFPFAIKISGQVANLRPAFTVKIKGLVIRFCRKFC